MLRIWLKKMWHLPTGDGLPATVGRRTLTILWSVVALMFILVSPAFLATHAAHELEVSAGVGRVLDGVWRLHSDHAMGPASDTPSALPMSLAERHGIGALYIMETSPAPRNFFLLGAERSVLANTDTSYVLGGGISFRNLMTSISVLFAPGNRFVRLVGAPDDDGRQLDVFVAKKHVSADVWELFSKGGVVVFLALLASHFILRWTIYRSVSHGFTSLIASLYGKNNISARAVELSKRLEDNHQAIEMHVAEQARLASLGSAASRLSHDVRNLLASLRLIAERFSGMDDEKSQKLGARMEANIDRALMLCDWAMRYKRDKRGAMEVSTHRLNPIIDEALSFVKLHDPRDRVELVNLVEGDISLMGERTLIFRILYNLFLNAIQAMQSHKAGRGFINVTAHVDEQNLYVDVVDGGPGMDADQMAMVRDICAGNQSGMQTQAVGLGILISADLTRWHGGGLELMRSDMMGTAFRVSLPLAGPARAESVGDAMAL